MELARQNLSELSKEGEFFSKNEIRVKIVGNMDLVDKDLKE